MKKSVKRILKLFVSLVFIGLLIFLQKLVMPKYMGEVKEGAFIAEYYEDKSYHDVIILGDCEAYENIDTVYLWEHYGINSFIRGSAKQLVWQSYYLLEDTLETEKPKVVIMSVLAMMYDTPQSEAYNRMTLDGMRWGSPKIKSIFASMTEGEEFIEYVFPLLRFHDRIWELDADDFKYLFKKKTISYNGYYMRADTKAAETYPVGMKKDDYTFGENAYKYMRMLAELCADEEIKLILIKAPSLYPYWYDEYEAQIEEFASEYGLKYINYLELADELQIDYNTDTYDGGLHLNVYGADKLTEHLGNILANEYEIPDRSLESELAEAWEQKYLRYYNDIAKQLKAEEENKGTSGTVHADVTGNVTHAPTVTPGVAPENTDFVFKYKGTEIAVTMNADSVIALLPDYDSKFEAPSCAFDGMDIIYNYGSFEINTYRRDGTDYVAAIVLKDDLTETAEGIYIGCTVADVKTAYGDTEVQNNVFSYKKENMTLRIFVSDEGTVTQIQYLSNVYDSGNK